MEPKPPTTTESKMKLSFSHDVAFGADIDGIEVPPQMDIRVQSGVDWFDGVLGGEGFVPSQVTFFTGAPGSGKTTSMLQVCSGLAKSGATVVFNSAEESPYQISRASKRIRSKGWKLGTETKMPDLLEKSKRLMDRERKSDPNKPFVLVVDSINCMDDGYFDSGRITTATAERSMEAITSWCKENWAIGLIIGQVTKSGTAAGSNKLRHACDTILTLTFEKKAEGLVGCRKLEVEKNRFGGGVGNVFWLGMTDRGLQTIATQQED